MGVASGRKFWGALCAYTSTPYLNILATPLGVENYDVGYYMLSQPLCGPGRGSIIPGQSVQNHIYLWGVRAFSNHLFYYLEERGLLEPLNETHLFCLHFVYQPYINNALKVFADAWSFHPRTACNRTPLQLWIQGILENHGSGLTVTNELYTNTEFVITVITLSSITSSVYTTTSTL